MMRRRRDASSLPRGMTLVEVLSAMAILSVMTTIGGAWIVGETRAARALNVSTSQTAALAQALDAIRRDLDESAPGSIARESEQSRVTMTTACRAPGQPAGWRSITWRLNKNHSTLERTERRLSGGGDEEQVNTALFGVAGFTVEFVEPADGAEALAILHIVIALTSGASAELVRRLD